MPIDTCDLMPRLFTLVVGNSRSGTTIVGSILDAHHRVICANETTASLNFWRGWSKNEIISEIIANSAANFGSGRPSSGYEYKIFTEEKNIQDIAVIADKIWNPTLLLLHGDFGLIDRVSQTVGCEVALIHCVRNPFDVISTMDYRSKAGISDRIKWYFNHCEAAQALYDRNTTRMLTIRNEDVIGSTSVIVGKIFHFIGELADVELISRVSDRVFRSARRTRDEHQWTDKLIKEVSNRITHFDFLKGYSYED
ncbi:MAG: hypothetical protein ACLQIQ_08360 [Beijerinckiaceae bacterium]